MTPEVPEHIRAASNHAWQDLLPGAPSLDGTGTTQSIRAAMRRAEIVVADAERRFANATTLREQLACDDAIHWGNHKKQKLHGILVVRRRAAGLRVGQPWRWDK